MSAADKDAHMRYKPVAPARVEDAVLSYVFASREAEVHGVSATAAAQYASGYLKRRVHTPEARAALDALVAQGHVIRVEKSRKK